MCGLKGNQRQLTEDRARGIVSTFQSNDVNTKELSVNKRMHKRALAVLKVLS